MAELRSALKALLEAANKERDEREKVYHAAGRARHAPAGSKKGSGDAAEVGSLSADTAKALAEVRQQLEEQETLIQGYGKENARLMQELRHYEGKQAHKNAALARENRELGRTVNALRNSQVATARSTC